MKKQAPNKPGSDSNLTHENECLKREIEVQKALIKDLKSEAKKRAQEHEIIVATSQQKDRIITKYQNKIERCKRTMEMMQRDGTSSSVVVEVIQDIVNDIAN